MSEFAYKWSVLFRTDQDSMQTLRLSYQTPVDKARVRVNAMEYLKENEDWLVSIEEIYPTEPITK